jgi:ribosomal protein S12 methylthiotransferase
MRTKSKKNKINVITLGCSKNIYDSEVPWVNYANGKDVAHEAPAAEEGKLLLLIPVGLLTMQKQNQ